ncbi:hypothetical protein GCM10010433_13820 [Streptomyces pulveraceus]
MRCPLTVRRRLPLDVLSLRDLGEVCPDIAMDSIGGVPVCPCARVAVRQCGSAALRQCGGVFPRDRLSALIRRARWASRREAVGMGAPGSIPMGAESGRRRRFFLCVCTE